MPKYFFSYARSDAEFVLRLARELREAGAGIWVDQLDILGGERWDQAIEGALHSCQGMIVVLSPQSVSSENVMDEVSFALEAKKLIVPVIKAECEIPFRLRRLQNVKFTSDFDAGLAKLIKALRIQRRSQPQVPSPIGAVPTKKPVTSNEGMSSTTIVNPPLPADGRGQTGRTLWKALIGFILGAVAGLCASAIVGAVHPRIDLGEQIQMAVFYGVPAAFVVVTTVDKTRLILSVVIAGAVALIGVILTLIPASRPLGLFALGIGVPVATLFSAPVIRRPSAKPKKPN